MITYCKGDLFKSSCNIICHQVNCQGVMGAGIARQIKEKFPACYEAYKEVVNIAGKEECLGKVYFYEHASGRLIANMFSQFDIYPRNKVHTDYNAFRKCCKSIKELVFNLWGKNTSDCKIGFPYKIGCGLAGGDWNIILNILKEEFVLTDYPNSENNYWNVEIWEL